MKTIDIIKLKGFELHITSDRYFQWHIYNVKDKFKTMIAVKQPFNTEREARADGVKELHALIKRNLV